MASCLVLSYDAVGEALLAAERHGEAIEIYEKGLKLVQDSAAEDRNEQRWPWLTGLVLCKIGDVYSEMGKRTQATTNFRKCLTVREHLASANPDRMEWSNDVSATYEKLAEVIPLVVMVEDVQVGAVAEKVGLMKGDLLLGYNDVKVVSVQHLIELTKSSVSLKSRPCSFGAVRRPSQSKYQQGAWA
jgi:hypothetical protein